MGTISSALQYYLYLILISLVWLEFYLLLEDPLGLWLELYLDSLLGKFLEVYCGWCYFKISYLVSRQGLGVIQENKRSFASSIFQSNLFANRISYPTMPARNRLRPINLTPLSLSHNGHLNNSVSSYYQQLIIKIAKSHRPKSNWNRNMHSRGDVSRFLPRVLDMSNHELFLLEGRDLYPLDAFWIVYQFYLGLIDVMRVVITEKYLRRLYSKLSLHVLWGKGFSIAQGLCLMPWVFGEGYLLVHAISDFLIINLGLYVKFR